MVIRFQIFEAYLKCPMKCWLRAAGEPGSGISYSEWTQAQNSSYRATEVARLVAALPNSEIATSRNLSDLKGTKWRLATGLAVDVQIDSKILETDLHAVQLVPTKKHGHLAHLIPIRFVFTNKLSKDDKLLLAFDAFLLSQSLGRTIHFGKIIHGDKQTASKMRIAKLASEVRKQLDKIAVLLASSTPPELILNRHCAACEFQARCHKEALQQDDLSLLSGMKVERT